MKYNELDKNQKYVDGHLHFLLYKGKYIHISDYSGLSGQKYENTIDKAIAFLKSLEIEGQEILNLVDFTNTIASPNVIKKLKEAATIFTKIHVKKTAAIGLTPLQKVFVSAFTAIGLVNIKVCDSREEALNWLVAD